MIPPITGSPQNPHRRTITEAPRVNRSPDRLRNSTPEGSTRSSEAESVRNTTNTIRDRVVDAAVTTAIGISSAYGNTRTAVGLEIAREDIRNAVREAHEVVTELNTRDIERRGRDNQERVREEQERRGKEEAERLRDVITDMELDRMNS